MVASSMVPLSPLMPVAEVTTPAVAPSRAGAIEATSPVARARTLRDDRPWLPRGRESPANGFTQAASRKTSTRAEPRTDVAPPAPTLAAVVIAEDPPAAGAAATPPMRFQEGSLAYRRAGGQPPLFSERAAVVRLTA